MGYNLLYVSSLSLPSALMFFKMLINLFCASWLGPLRSFVGPCVQQLFCLLFIFCSVHDNQGYPLSAVSMTLLLSSFSSFRAWNSFYDMIGNGLGVHCALFKAFFTSTLISSASPLFNLEQVDHCTYICTNWRLSGPDGKTLAPGQ